MNIDANGASTRRDRNKKAHAAANDALGPLDSSSRENGMDRNTYHKDCGALLDEAAI